MNNFFVFDSTLCDSQAVYYVILRLYICISISKVTQVKASHGNYNLCSLSIHANNKDKQSSVGFYVQLYFRSKV